MSSRTPTLSWQCIFGYSLIGVLASLNAAWADVTGGIATDGTMGAAQILNDSYVTIPQSLGTTTGGNLFHSFSEFNIAKGQTVEFTGSNALQNVISRVTGTDVTEIEGTLRSSIAKAAFYFINPNGVAFGEYAQVNVPGAFHISTADKIDFPNNGGVFYADSNRASTLSSEAPVAFGFLDTSAANNGLIEVNGSDLAVGDGHALDLVAGEITVENGAVVSASAGQVRLVATQGAGSVNLEQTDGKLPLPAATPSVGNAGSIIVDASAVDTSGDGGGRIALWGKDASFTNSTAYADNNGATVATSAKGVDIRSYSLSLNNSTIAFDAFGTGQAGSVTVQAGMLDILNGGIVSSSTFAKGDAGNVAVTADTLRIDGRQVEGTGILSVANVGSEGQAGNVIVQAGTLDILNGGAISSSTVAQGDAGSVAVTADVLTINSQGFLSGATGISSQAESGSSGQAGDVTVEAGTLDILNGGQISSSTYAQGDAGNVKVTANDLTINSQGFSSLFGTGIFSGAEPGSIGHAGNVDVRAGTLDIFNGGTISSSTNAQGYAGSVAVTADSLTINGQGFLSFWTGIFSVANLGSSGQAGSVTVQAGVLDIFNGGKISSSTLAQGDAGSVAVTADSLTINSQGFSFGATGIDSQAESGSGGQAGDVTVQAGTLDILNGGQISSSTFAQGDAGSVAVMADTLTINSQGNSSGNATGIVSQAELGSGGQAGSVTVRAGMLDMLNGGSVSSSTFDQGAAGNVNVQAGTVGVFSGSYISSASWGDASSGRTGDVIVTASDWLHLADVGIISIENEANFAAAASIDPGSINVTAPDIDMKDSAIISKSTGNVSAGNIVLNFSHWLTMDPSAINTTANTGNGGAIIINGGELIHLQNSGFRTTVSGANSNGGDIFTTANMLVMDTGLIQANAVGGSGGNITLSLDSLIPSGNTLLLGGSTVAWQPFQSTGLNVIQAASQAGVSGAVNVTAPQLNLSGIIANLGGPQFDTSIISQDYCGLGTGSSLTRKGAGGLKPKSGDQLLF